MTILIIVLIFLILVALAKASNNSDLIKKYQKTVVDNANIKNAKKHYRIKPIPLALYGVALVAFVISILCEFTDIETVIIDALSTDFIDKAELSKTFYLVAPYLIAVNEIFIQVHISEYLHKFFNETEIEPEINVKDIKKILYKPAKPKKEEPKDPNQVVRTNELNEVLDEEIK